MSPELQRAGAIIQTATTLIQISEQQKQRNNETPRHPEMTKLCGGLHGASASDDSACLPPPDLTVEPAPEGTVARRALQSCAEENIAAQIRQITEEGERLKQGAGIRRVNQITVEVLDASIYIYQQAMLSCDVDQTAYQNAINQLEASKAVAEENVQKLT